ARNSAMKQTAARFTVAPGFDDVARGRAAQLSAGAVRTPRLRAYNQRMNTPARLRCARPFAVATLFVLALCCAPAARAADRPAVPDTLQQRIAACTTCHGVHGEGRAASGYFPR